MNGTMTLSIRPDRFNQAPTMSSREIAELTGKDHKNVLADIREILDTLLINCADFSAQYKDASGKMNPMFVLPKRETLILVSGYSVAMRAKIIDRWQELETKAAKHAFALPDFTNPAAAARAWADAIEASQTLAIERDNAVASKAQIGSRREATAMATASAARKEAVKLKDQLGFNIRNATVIAVEGALGKKFGKQDWRPLKAWCKENGVPSVTVPCARYGKVQAWPAGAWGAVYGIDLRDLFGASE